MPDILPAVHTLSGPPVCAVVAAGHKTVEPVGYCKATACVLTDVADEPGSTAAWPSTSGESGKASTKSVILLRYNGQNFLAIFSSVYVPPKAEQP